ncbi:hypothetical protein [Caulifigura coniformis]|uniref:hypothetical protein n=1 Tax=Caulifigura coniformis TaxID=2527983 RepID=UPI0011AACF67|nr:hypothetical protein [Caulifigura coniformis]
MAAFVFARTGRFVPERVNDTAGYTDFDFRSWKGVLTSIRTPGYPLLLRAIGLISASPTAVPVAHFVLFAAAVWLFFEALRQMTGRCWLSLWIAACLLSSAIFVTYNRTIATDTPGGAIGVLSAALLLFWTVRPRLALLLAIGGATVAGWLIRPVGVFLVVWIPLVGAWLVAWRSHSSLTDPSAPPADARPTPAGAFLRLSLTAVIPLMVWIGLRGALFGHWGVACFDGYNLIGLAGQFVTPETTARLSPDQRQVVEAALASRAERRKGGAWFLDEPPLHYLRLEYNHDDTIWKDYLPPARQVVGDEPLALNAFLGGMARTIIASQPLDYCVWLVKATRQAVRKVFSDTLQYPVSLALLLVGVVFYLTLPLRPPPSGDAMQTLATLRLVAVLAVSYAVLNLLCTIPFVPPRERMTDAAALWGPPLLAAWVASLVSRCRHRGAAAVNSPASGS